MADEVGAAFVSLVPSFQNGPKIIGAELEKAFAGSDKVAARAGAAAGKQFGAAFGKDKGAASAAESAEKRIASAAASAAKQVKSAREAEADAARKTAIEEKKLQELRESGKAKASQILAVEDRLVKSQRAMRDAAGKTAAAVKGQEQQQAVAREEMAKTATETDKASESALTFGDRLKKIIFPKGVFKGVADDAADAGKKAGGRFKKLFESSIGKIAIGSAIGGAVSSAGLSALSGARDLITESITAASDMNETVSKSKTIFGDQAGAIDRWANDAATSFGLAKSEALDYAAGFGDMARQIGFTGEASAAFSTDIVQTAADLGSFNNLGTDEVLDKISGAMRGEYDSLQALIPNISAARVEQEALALSGKKNTKELTAQDKALAVQAILHKDGARAMGDFAKTSGGFANQQKILSASFETVKERLGTALMPILNQAMGFITGTAVPAVQSLAGWFADQLAPKLAEFGETLKGIWPTVQSVFGFIGSNIGLIAPLVGIVAGIVGVIRLWTIAQGALNVVMSLNPIGLVVLAIAALVAGLVLAYQNSETFRNIVNSAWEAVKVAVKVAGDFIMSVLGAIGGFFTQTLPNALNTFLAANDRVFNTVVGIVRSFWNERVKPVVDALVTFFTQTIPGAFNRFLAANRLVFNTVVGIVRSFWNDRVKPVVDRLVNFFKITIPAAFGLMRAKALAIFAAVVSVIRGFWFDKVKPVVDRVVNFFSKTIPGAFLKLKDKAVEIFRKVRDFIRGAFDKDKGIPSIFTKAVAQIGKIWQGLQDLAKIPIRFIVDTVINGGLIKAFNGLVGMIPFADDKWKLPPMALPQGFAQGGILPGSSTWRQGDNRLVPMRDGEGVTITEALDSYETRRLLTLNRHVLSGGTPDSFRKKYGEGYAKGGVVWPATSRQLSGSYKGHSGVDIPRPAGDPIFAIMNGAIDYTGYGRGYGQAVFERLANGLMAVYGHTSRVMVRAGQAVQAGQKIAEIGSTGNSTGNHLHIEVNGAGGFGSSANRQFTLDFLNGSSNASGSSDGGTESGFNPLGFVLDMARDKLKGAVSGLLKDVPNTGIGALVRGIPNGLIDYLYTSVKGMVGQSGSSGDFGDGTSGVDGATSAITRAAAAAIGPRFGISSIGTYPGHDPSETKALDFMTTDLKKHNSIAQYVWGNARDLGVNYMISWNRIWNIQRDAVGAWRRYTRYGGGGDASQQHKNHVHLSFFAKGTKKAPAGPAVVGENGPELVWFKGGEQVTPARQTQDLMKAKEITSHSFGMASSEVPANTANDGWHEVRITNWDTGQAMIRRVSRSESRQDAAFDRGLSRMGGK